MLSVGLMSRWYFCSLNTFKSTPAALWTIHFGLPVVPDENKIKPGRSNPPGVEISWLGLQVAIQLLKLK